MNAMIRAIPWAPLVICLAVLAVTSPFLMPGKALFPVHTDALTPWAETAGEEARDRARQEANFLCADKLYMFHPEVVHTREAYLGKRLPAWNHHILGGVPQAATGIPAAFSPLTALHLVMDPLRAYGVIAAIQLAMAGLFLYAFLRAMGQGTSGALVGALVFGLSGWMAARLEYYQIAGAAAWIPMILFGLEKILATGRMRYGALLALGTGLTFLSGFVQVSVLGGYVAAAWALYRLPGLTRDEGARCAAKRLLFCAFSGLAGLLLSAPQMAPSLHLALSGLSTRDLAGLDPIRARALAKGALSGFLLPDLMGHGHLDPALASPLNAGRTLLGEAWMGRLSNVHETAVYLGLLPLCLMAGMPALLGRARTWFFLLLAAAGVVAALDTKVLHVATKLPGLNIGDPKRYLFVTVLALAVLTGLAAHRFHARIAEGRPVRGPALAGLLLALSAGVLAVWVFFFDDFGTVLTERLARIFNTTTDRIQNNLDPKTIERASDFLAGRLGLLAGLSLVASILLFIAGRRGTRTGTRRTLLVLLVILGIADLGHFAATLNHPMAVKDFARPTALNTFLTEARHERGPFRIARYRDADVGDQVRYPPKTPALEGTEDVQGYVAIYLKRYRELMDLIEPGLTESVGMRSFKRVESLSSPLLDLMGVRYVLTGEDAGEIPEPWREVDRVDGVRLIENPEALPRAFVVPPGDLRGGRCRGPGKDRRARLRSRPGSRGEGRPRTSGG